MKKIVRFVCAALLAGTAASAAPVFAEDAKPAGFNPDEVKKALGISFYVQGGYTYNGNASDGVTKSSENDLGCSTTRRTASASIWRRSWYSGTWRRRATSGYKIKLSTGETAKWIHARGLSGAPLDTAAGGRGDRHSSTSRKPM